MYAVKNKGIDVDCLAVKQLPRSGTTAELMHFEKIDAAAIIAAVKANN
jgi:hypothetical protein